MAKYIVSFQRTSNAFGSNHEVSEHLWYEISRHTSVSAARKALEKEQAEMHEYTGPAGWSHNVRLIALADIQMKNEFSCENCFRSEELKFTWPKGEICPVGPAHPDGWDYWRFGWICDHAECQKVFEADCDRLEKELRAAETDYEQEERERAQKEREEWEIAQEKLEREAYNNHPDREIEKIEKAMKQAFESGNPTVKLSKSGNSVIFSNPAYGRSDLSGRIYLARKQMVASGISY